MGIVDMSTVSTDDLDNELDAGEEIVAEENDGEEIEAGDEDDEFADLFGDENDEDSEDLETDAAKDEKAAAAAAETATAAAAAQVELANKKPAAQELKPSDTPDLIPGTPEYIDRLASESEALVKKLLGVEEYDPFDSKHIAAFNRISRKLDEDAEKLYGEKIQQAEEQKAAVTAYNNAEQNIGKILNTPDLEAKFDAVVHNLPVSKYFEMQEKAKKGDYTSFINLANKVAGLKAKVDQVNNREPPAPHAGKDEDSEPVQRGAGSVADFLGI